MEVKFKESGDSPEIGPFVAGEIRVIPEHIARIYISRGQAEEARISKASKGQEVKPDGK